MCTAISFHGRDFYLGRTLDTEYDFGEVPVFAGRRFSYFNEEEKNGRYAIIGMAKVIGGYPLFFDGMNEEGLCMAALNYGTLAAYAEGDEGEGRVAPFRLIPYILSRCKNLTEAKEALENITLVNKSPASELDVARLHFIIADKTGAITAEPEECGLKIYENPFGVLSNAPEFPYHEKNLSYYMNVTPAEAENRFSNRLVLTPYGRGVGSFGLPGDLSSPSRFVRACFYKFNLPPLEGDEGENLSNIFHVLGSVEQIRGAVRVKDGLVHTRYASVMNANTGVYYYKTYGSFRINAVSMLLENPDNDEIVEFPLHCLEVPNLVNKKD